jgi:hypothetical protein
MIKHQRQTQFATLIDKPHERTDMKKLVCVSVWVSGRREWTFAEGEVGADGKVRVDESVVNGLLNRLRVERGMTYTIGY